MINFNPFLKLALLAYVKMCSEAKPIMLSVALAYKSYLISFYKLNRLILFLIDSLTTNWLFPRS